MSDRLARAALMITREYCASMARYNLWQNNQLKEILQALDKVEITRNRGAFFGSILGTLNHLLWGDALWVSRFDGGEPFGVGGEESVTLFATIADWAPARAEMDARIMRWADGVSETTLEGPLRFYSVIKQAELSKPMAVCVMQLFNHQTHHRGQVHAMLTAAGSRAPVSDLVFMPGEV